VEVEALWLAVFIVRNSQLGWSLGRGTVFLFALGFALRLFRLFLLAGTLFLSFVEAGS
jgi:hypothetical protein